ncbi:putative DNA-binding transcriptional regulator YafY [Crossiella equi]|uniref:DNA-binding transcriptional regulator YafY n=1 Tax=Crossiella equi TaxID=130796 RepID=A0ABS5AN28_9PSEU|nr:YafY family protein [Crossiella equi]MBP2477989.1 putative DNA-binding transcriptional regulator YafY [Crossiella equi]
MKETSARLLRLLTLLQMRREWSGGELADRLGVTGRTVRRDIEKLRDLEYPIESLKGAAGGYRLGSGADLPPLLLDDEEAVAVAIGLRTATNESIEGIGEASLRALVKLEQVLPSRLRRRVAALQIATVPLRPMPTISSDTLTTIAAACRDTERLRFDYRGHDGTDSLREVEPHHLVTWGRRWYLVAWDTARRDWRTFRVDRMRTRTPTGPRFTPRQLPTADPASFVSEGVSRLRQYSSTVRLPVDADTAQERGFATWGRVEPESGDSCLLHVTGSDMQGLAWGLGMLGIDFEVVDAPELAEHLLAVADRLRRAVPGGASGAGAGGSASSGRGAPGRGS